MEIKPIKKQFDIEILLEFMYLFILALYLIRQFFDTTMFSIPWPWYYEKLIRVLAFCVVFLKTGYGERCKDCQWFLCVLTGVVFAFSWISTGYEFLLDIGILVIGAKDIPYKKILKVYIWCGSVILTVAILGALTGCIEDLLYEESPGKYRHAFGIIYPTDFAAHIVYLLLAVWVTYEQIPTWGMALAGSVLTAFLYRYTYAKCSTIVMAIAIVGLVYEFLESKMRKSKTADCIRKALNWCFVSAFSILAAVTCWGMICYNEQSSTLERINRVLTGRLELANRAFNSYGIKIFGTPFDMIGAGGITVFRQGYNFVDISYCMILLRYGLLLLLAVIVLHTGIAIKAQKAKNEKLLIALALVALHSAIEHHLTELGYNIFLLLAFSCVDAPAMVNVTEHQLKEKRICEGYYSGLFLLGTFVFPYVISYGRTVVSILGLYENWRHKYFIIAALIGIIGVLLVIQTIKCSILTWGQKQKLSLRIKNLLVLEVILLAASISSGMYLVSRCKNRIMHRLDAGIRLITELKNTESFQGEIYVDDYPEIYIQESENVSRRILPGESAWNEDNVVLITRREQELQHLIREGYQFAELSDTESVYTNSEEAIQLLRQNGAAVNDCYSVKTSVDLQNIANANGLQYEQNEGVLIEGASHSLLHGPWITLHQGRLRVTYRLRLLSSSIEQGPVATVRISANSGKTIYKEETIDRSLFDENGICDYSIEQGIGDAEGYEFLLFAENDTTLWLEDILYGKVPAQSN
ncbi:hypothetical protein WMO41_11975 [Ventrimonas sp. CLA-AP-H27]|uniref:Uncharacterized protein n=1 Tax=Ventrimonas faecis TaxID=3133170 RepID=A0ABV1HNH7_9FIRM